MSATAANLLPAPSTSSKTHTQQPPHLELRIFTNHVGLYFPSPENITSDADARSAMTTNPPSPASPSTSTCLLSGPLDDFLHFSRREQSKWLIDIAHDVCDPVQKRGSLRVWDAAGQTWKDVDPTDPLTASIYLYDVQTAITVTKISKRRGKSKSSVASNPSTMADRVRLRDGGQCWVTKSDDQNMVSNSHICPRRMGDYQFRIIYAHFVSALPSGLPTDDELSVNDEPCGITLDRNLEGVFGVYKLGLRRVGSDQYECHYFPEVTRRGYNILVRGPVSETVVSLHGFRIKPPQPQHKRNPPPGLFRWHYLQCVVRKFVHSDYQNMEHINYYELPLRMEGNSDDEGTDSEFDWPSAVFDRGRAMQAAMKQNEERHRSVAEWAIAVS